jgi:purine-nucleoside phosphorylase
MSIHIGAKDGEIAETVLMPGDPLRAAYIAETFLTDALCYSRIRNMFGFTGTYKGKRVSIQGSGMGIPSLSIYAEELIRFYGVKRLIRVGSCGALQKDIKIRDILMAMTASTDSGVNRLAFRGMDFAPAADFQLLLTAWNIAKERGIPVRVGNILSSDVFYGDEENGNTLWARYGVLAVEMETNALYTIAAKHGVSALSILTVSDSLVTEEAVSAQERERTFNEMAEIALECAVRS